MMKKEIKFKFKQNILISKKKIWKIFSTTKNLFFRFKNNYIGKYYKRLGLIDEGTYGKVFKARRFKNLKIYACKGIQIGYKFDENFPTSLREINLLFSLKHPNVIFAKEICLGKSFNQIFIIMEYCEHDLKSILNSRVKFSLGQIKYIMLQILRGVKILHENLIIHRDLKTSNILLNHRGIIKICDFGLARIYNNKNLSMTQGIVTLWYRAPEILLGEGFYKTSVDIWSIGCIFGELILNEVLFSGKSELDQLGKIFSVMGTPTSEIWLNLHLLPAVRKIKFPIQPFNNLSKKFLSLLDCKGLDLLQRLLTYDPFKRISVQKAILHPFFY